MKYKFIVLALLFQSAYAFSQYAPAAGKTGSSALYMDSSIFKNWAKHCTISRGWKNCQQKDSGYTSIGESNSACGKAGTNGVVSLGDSGSAICQFIYPIKNGKGYDFAVFENTFDDRFLELAFVEVSSDGEHFFRFQSHSLTNTATQTSAFGYTEPENINNLAGKYRYGYGTPFDLNELPDTTLLNKNNILYVKIVDVVGSINPSFASYDSASNIINDPWPTPFASGGFDLDAIGVIHQQPANVNIPKLNESRIEGPNPISEHQKLVIYNEDAQVSTLKIYNTHGQIVYSNLSSQLLIEIEAINLPLGLFYIELRGHRKFSNYRGIKL